MKMSKRTQEDRSPYNVSSISVGSVQLDSFPRFLSESTELGMSPHEHWDWVEDFMAGSACRAKHQESPKQVNLLWSLEKEMVSDLEKGPQWQGWGGYLNARCHPSLPIWLQVVLISCIALHSLWCLAVHLNSDPCVTAAFDLTFLNQ